MARQNPGANRVVGLFVPQLILVVVPSLERNRLGIKLAFVLSSCRVSINPATTYGTNAHAQ